MDFDFFDSIKARCLYLDGAYQSKKQNQKSLESTVQALEKKELDRGEARERLHNNP